MNQYIDGIKKGYLSSKEMNGYLNNSGTKESNWKAEEEFKIYRTKLDEKGFGAGRVLFNMSELMHCRKMPLTKKKISNIDNYVNIVDRQSKLFGSRVILLKGGK